MKHKIALGVLIILLIMSNTFVNADAVKNEKTEENYEPTGIDRETNYFIKADDAVDVLDDSYIDDIAVITLICGKNVDISQIKIVITNDRVNYYETRIVEKGLWEIGNTITIREVYPNQIKPGYYKVYVEDVEDNIPFAVDYTLIDNASINESILFNQMKTMLADMPGYKTSKHDSVRGDIAAAVEYVGRLWNPHSKVWEYNFYMDAVFKGQNCEYIELKTDKSNIEDVAYVRNGAWNLDEYEEPTDLEEIAEFVCKKAISALPGGDFIVSGSELADLLKESFDVKWQISGWQGDYPEYASGFTWQEVFVVPNRIWEIKDNFKARGWYDVYSSPKHYDLSLENGDGKIVFGEKAPPPPPPSSIDVEPDELCFGTISNQEIDYKSKVFWIINLNEHDTLEYKISDNTGGFLLSRYEGSIEPGWKEEVTVSAYANNFENGEHTVKLPIWNKNNMDDNTYITLRVTVENSKTKQNKHDKYIRRNEAIEHWFNSLGFFLPVKLQKLY